MFFTEAMRNYYNRYFFAYIGMLRQIGAIYNSTLVSATADSLMQMIDGFEAAYEQYSGHLPSKALECTLCNMNRSVISLHIHVLRHGYSMLSPVCYELNKLHKELQHDYDMQLIERI